ncbi:MAG TPA: hypothetical protein VH186_38155 [Chloroflexia bacterium]|nr:hypothetical protein [Chloroflexia bacterium]
MAGIPTVLITVSAAESAQMRPPRAIEPVGFNVGNSLGHPGQADLQRQVLQTSIEYLNQLVMPGKISTISFPGY